MALELCIFRDHAVCWPPPLPHHRMESALSFNPNNTLGAYQIGVLASYALFGVLTTQTYIYYTRFPDDSSRLKALVAFVWVCEVAHAICVGHTLYVYTISDYGHPERIGGPAPKSFDVAILFSGAIAASGFFSFRIYAFSRKLWIPTVIWGMSFLRLLGSLVVCITTLRMSSLARFVAQWEWFITTVWSISAANDLAITATLVVLLRHRRSTVIDLKRTAALVDKLILWTVETGLLTSAFSLIMLACFVTMRENFIYLGLFTVEARGDRKVFSNSLLASLNSRATLRAMDEVSVPFSVVTIGLPANSRQTTKEREITTTARDDVI
ncbi:hypothetical protein B0H13DRAFT_898990 [Mycena leptocephala]|nr:hypothetical protein B0H13DRAFT_898990 [Mycena leptocephala]